MKVRWVNLLTMQYISDIMFELMQSLLDLPTEIPTDNTIHKSCNHILFLIEFRLVKDSKLTYKEGR